MDDYQVVVLDFETSGLSPYHGGRAIEIGAVLIEKCMIVDRFQSLMNPGFMISPFIESFTGITNEMISSAPPCEEVMEKFVKFIGARPLVAHNASFDRKFLDAELGYINRSRQSRMACSMLAARRIFPKAPNHKLATLVSYCGIYHEGIFHRALADATMTGHLWIAMIDALKDTFGIKRVDFELMRKLCGKPRAKVETFLTGVAVQQKHG